MNSKSLHHLVGVVMTATLIFVAASAFAQSWQTAQKLNIYHAKSARLYATENGCHFVYAKVDPSWTLTYRRYENGVLLSPVYLKTVFCPGMDITEAGNGDIHLAWENWEPDNEAGWAISTNDGVSFSYQTMTSGQQAKWPMIEAIGPDTSDDIMLSYGSFVNKSLKFNLWNGSSWGNWSTFGNFDNEYCMTDIYRSPKDGTVYRQYGENVNGDISVIMKRYNGNYWEEKIIVDNSGFFARSSLAVNPAGQVMCLWEQNSRVYIKLYTPGSGFGARIDVDGSNKGYAKICHIPRTNDFYVVYTDDSKRLWGKRYYAASGSLGTRELVSNGLGDAFSLGADVHASPDGTLYACWERWEGGQPQQYFNVKPAPVVQTGYLQGYVRDQYGVGISGVTVSTGAYTAVSGAGGAYLLETSTGTNCFTASKDYYTGQTICSITINQGMTTTQDFTVTASPPAAVSSFSADPSDSIVRLLWQNPTSGNFQGTMVRYSTTSYPTSPTDGTLLFDRHSVPGDWDGFDHTGLANGVTYYYTAFAHDADGHYSAGTQISATPQSYTIGQVKQMPDETVIDLFDKIVIGTFTSEGAYYIQEPDRSSGIRINAPPTGLNPGDVVDVSGILRTRTSGGLERELQNISVTVKSSGDRPRPVGMGLFHVGGASYSPYITGVQDANGNMGSGANNVGKLVKVWGKVTDKVTYFLFIDDGSGIPELVGRTGVMVRFPSVNPPAQIGDYVAITGVVMGNKPSGYTVNRRYIYAQDFSDLQVLQSSGTIAGNVVDAWGTGIAGATVSTTPGGYSATTGTYGTYTVLQVGEGQYDVTASATGYTDSTQTNITVTSGQTTTLNFVLASGKGKISGYVSDTGGQAISGATVTTNSGGYSTTSGDGGYYVITNVSPGTYSVTAEKTDYQSHTETGVTVTADATTTVNFNLHSMLGTISGHVRDTSGNPIGSASVYTSTGGYSTTSSSDGSYTLTQVSPGTYSVAATKSGYNPQTHTGVQVVGQQTTSLDFSLSPQPGTITGYVYDQSGSPIAGATVSTNTGGYTTTTASSGSYTLSGVAAGSYNVTASKTNYSPQSKSATVSPGGTVPLSFNLAGLPGSISGFVYDSGGTPLSGASVSTSSGGYSTTTGTNGGYTLNDVSPGTYNMTASKSLYNPQTVNNVVVNPNQNTSQNFNLVYNPVTEKLVNGNFSGGFFDFWGGTIGNSWGACWDGGFQQAIWDDYNAGGAYGLSQGVMGQVDGFKVGIGQTVHNLTPGATYTFSASFRRTGDNCSAWMGVKPGQSDNQLPSSGTNVPVATGQWVTGQVTGTVDATGKITVYAWVVREWGSDSWVYLDNLSVMSW